MVFEINMFSTFNRAGDEPAMGKEMKKSWQKAQSLPSKQTDHTVYPWAWY